MRCLPSCISSYPGRDTEINKYSIDNTVNVCNPFPSLVTILDAGYSIIPDYRRANGFIQYRKSRIEDLARKKIFSIISGD